MDCRGFYFCVVAVVVGTFLHCSDSIVASAARTGQIQGDDGGGQYGGVFRVPLLNNPKTLDPPHIQDIYGHSVIAQIFNGLVRFSPDLLVVPCLAESWQVEEKGRVYKFFLKKDARFHNGRRVTTRDVIFSLSRLLRVAPPPATLPHLLKIVGAKEYSEGRVDHVAGFRGLDENTLVVELEEPYVPFLIALGMYQAVIVPAEEAEKGRDFGVKPIGSGPFRFVSWEQNKIIRLERFPDYHQGKAFLDGIEFPIYPGGQIEEVYNAFIRGELDEMPVYGKIKERLAGHKHLTRIHRPSLSLLFYGFNCRHPSLRNPDLRRALSLAIDRRKLVDQVYNRQFEPANGIMPPGIPGYQPQGQGEMHDGPKALELFNSVTKAESAPLESIEVVSNVQSPSAQAELKFVGDSWAKLGITLVPKFIHDWSQFEQYLRSDSVQVYRYAWYADMPDPDAILQPLLGIDGVANFMRYQDDTVNGMLQTARFLVDPVERARTYQEIQRKIGESHPMMPLFYLSIDLVWQPYVQGIPVSALGAQNNFYHKLWLKKPTR